MLGIVTVQWNASNASIQFSDSIFPQLADDARLMLLDNGSEKFHWRVWVNHIEEFFIQTSVNETARVIAFQNKFNSGFARANNIGIRYLLDKKTDWIWLLNNDVILKANTISQLKSKLEHLQPGIYGTSIEDVGGKIETHAGYRFNLWTTKFRPLTITDWQQERVPDNGYISGASMLVHREVFETCGLLDESTFLYFEELDFCQRAKTQGFGLGWLSEISIIHKGAGSSRSVNMEPKIMYHETWSTLYFYSKHHKNMFAYILAVRTVLRVFTLLIKLRFNEIPMVFCATHDFILGRNKDLLDVKIIDKRYYQ